MKITRSALRKIILEVVVASNDTKEKVEDLEKSIKQDNPEASDEDIDDAINKLTKKQMQEELKRLSYVSKEQGHTYGLEHLPDQYDQKKADDIIGHTWLTHVRKKGSSLNEVGYVLWHSLNESGHVAVYDVEWPDGTIERNIPARLLEKVKDSNDNVDEHDEHGVVGHEEESLLGERKYKKRKGKKKKKASKKKPKYWYLGGYGIDHDHDFADFGGDFGGDGGGEWK